MVFRADMYNHPLRWPSDPQQCQLHHQLPGTFVKVVGWYDNE